MSLGHKQDAVIITQWECLAMRFRPRGQRAERAHTYTLAVVAGRGSGNRLHCESFSARLYCSDNKCLKLWALTEMLSKPFRNVFILPKCPFDPSTDAKTWMLRRHKWTGCVCGLCLRGTDLLLVVDYVALWNGKKPELDLLINHFWFST